MDTLLAALALVVASAALALGWRGSARVERISWAQRRADLLVSLMEVRQELDRTMTALEEFALEALDPLASSRLERLMERTVANEAELTRLRVRLDALGIPARITAASRADLETVDFEARTVRRQTERICQQALEFGVEIGGEES